MGQAAALLPAAEDAVENHLGGLAGPKDLKNFSAYDSVLGSSSTLQKCRSA